jgi:DNA-binding MarR family transcriptional regulator
MEDDVVRTTADEALLAVARLALDASVRAASDLGGISPVQLRALTALRQKGALNLVRLADEIGITVSTASRLVDRLVAVDWVHRASSARNRREISLTLTTSGKRLLRQFDDRRLAILTTWLERLPPDRREAVVEAFAQFADLAST